MTATIHPLASAGGPAAFVAGATERAVLEYQVRSEPGLPDTTFVHVRGDRMRTTSGCLDELAAALQFPIWFGNNWDALIDVLRDRMWLTATVLVCYRGQDLLADASDRDAEVFAEIIGRCHAEQEEEGEESSDGFHLLLQVEPADVVDTLARWQGRGLDVDTLALD